MNRTLRLSAWIVGALLVAMMTASAASAAVIPYVGAWESIDPADGSYQWLTIGGGGPGDTLEAVYCDTGASIFGVDPDTGEPLYACIGKIVFETVDDELSGVFDVRTLGPDRMFLTVDLQLVYDPATDSLTDGWGGVWYRRGARMLP